MRRALAAAVLSTVLVACGYRFTAGGGPLPGGARTLFVPVFRNASAEPGLEGPFTDAFRQELARAGREGGELSDAVAVGEIVSVVGGPVIFTNSFNDAGVPLPAATAAYQVQATVVVRVLKGGVQIAETKVMGGEDYLPRLDVTANALATGVLEAEANRRMALRRLAGVLMRQAYQNLCGF
ncbi:MAG: LPS assembly lipoprotein LptE [Myxococcales bacterium]